MGFSSLFGGGSSRSVVSTTNSTPTPMVDQYDPAILAAKKKRLEQAASESGRASTILTDNDVYGGSKLGLR